MTQQTPREYICYIQTDNGIVVLGQYKNMILTVKDCPSDATPSYLQNETQITFILENGTFNTELNDKLLRFNFTFNCDKTANNNNEGRYEVYHCKYDMQDGKLKGIAEGMRFIPQTVEEFITSNK
jgi:hypothetical protein